MNNKWVYIASPYTGDEENNTKYQISNSELLRELGFVPIWPLATHYWHLMYPHDYEYWMKLDVEYIKRCDILLRCGGASTGADREVRFAHQQNIPVVYSIAELLEFFS